MRLRNAAGQPVSIEIRDNAYKTTSVSQRIEPSQEISVVLHLEKVTAGMTTLSSQVAQTQKRALPAGWRLEGQALRTPSWGYSP